MGRCVPCGVRCRACNTPDETTEETASKIAAALLAHLESYGSPGRSLIELSAADREHMAEGWRQLIVNILEGC